MRQKLPERPHLDHLKKQAKDLLDAHKRGDGAAMARIRDALPAFASSSDDDIARASFALHDAQSAIAREYGSASWNELRAEVARRNDEAFQRVMVRSLVGTEVSEEVLSALKSGHSLVEGPAPELPETLPLVPVRSMLFLPHTVAPIHVGRAPTFAAIEAARRASIPMVAVFSQRAAKDESITDATALHPIGCQALVHATLPDRDSLAFVVIAGIRWISLASLTPPDAATPHATVRVLPVLVDRADPAGELPRLFASLRDRARRLCTVLPDPPRALAVIDAAEDAERLCDLVIAHLGTSVEQRAHYASETRLLAKLRMAIALCDDLASAMGRIEPAPQ